MCQRRFLHFIVDPGLALSFAVKNGSCSRDYLFDFQWLRRTEDIRTAPLLAASIFLDVLNVFLLFLSIFGRGAGAATRRSGFLPPRLAACSTSSHSSSPEHRDGRTESFSRSRSSTRWFRWCRARAR
jgi:hypothetical protein